MPLTSLTSCSCVMGRVSGCSNITELLDELNAGEGGREPDGLSSVRVSVAISPDRLVDGSIALKSPVFCFTKSAKSTSEVELLALVSSVLPLRERSGKDELEAK